MRKQTDLAAMKQLARVFLMMDPEPTSFSPVIIKHPFTDSGIVTVRSGNEYRAADITADEAVRSQWREQMASLIENAETPRHIYMMLTKSYVTVSRWRTIRKSGIGCMKLPSDCIPGIFCHGCPIIFILSRVLHTIRACISGSPAGI